MSELVLDGAQATYAALRDHGRSDLAAKLPLSLPFALHVETSNLCNFSCKMCPVSFDDWEQVVGGVTALSLDDMERLYSDVAAMGSGRLKVLRLYGEGEPLLDKNIAEWIANASARGLAERIELTTNASALTEAVGQKLIDAKLNYLRVSIYGATEDRQRDVTQSKVTAKKIFDNVRRFRALRDASGALFPRIYVKMIESHDLDDSKLFLDRYRGVGDEVAIEPAMDWDSFEGRDLLNAAALVRRPETFGSVKRRVCAYPFYSLVIKADGAAVACCVDWNKHTTVGNIREESLSNIWNGPRLRALREMHLQGRRSENPSCASCSFLETLPDNLDSVPESEFSRILNG